MNPERQIRFLYPPLFLLASLAWGLYLDPNKCLNDLLPPELSPSSPETLLGLIAAGGVGVLAFGFLIGTVSVASLRILFFVFAWGRHYEAAFTKPLYTVYSTVFAMPGTPQKADALYIAATFDHVELPEDMHDWLLRRWNAFNIAIHSVVGLGLALLIGWRLGITLSTEWKWTSAAVAGLFLFTGAVAWWETNNMFAFQVRRAVAKGANTTTME